MVDDAYPPAPWLMHGQLWATLFKVRDAVDELRPAGVYGVAFVKYEEGSPLTYSELLVARPISSSQKGRWVSISDIWVDSPASAAGGRALWSIPKELCDFSLDTHHTGPWQGARWDATLQRRPIAGAHFRDVSRLAPRLPFTGRAWQPPIDGRTVAATSTLTSSARSLPCRATWDFAADGPLGWLRGSRQLASFRMLDLRMSFA